MGFGGGGFENMEESAVVQKFDADKNAFLKQEADLNDQLKKLSDDKKRLNEDFE